MIVFITHPKYFDLKKLINKKDIEIVFIFNSKSLYKNLSKKYKCINIDYHGKISAQNFFPPIKTIEKESLYNFLAQKKRTFQFFKKKLFYQQKKRGFYINRWEMEREIRLYLHYINKEKKLFRKFELLDKYIYITLNEILKMEKGYTKDENFYIKKMLNYSSTFFIGYAYSIIAFKEAKFIVDFFRYNFFLNTLLYYGFEKKDIYHNSFHYNYLKIISHLFIEYIHKIDLKKELNIYIRRSNGINSIRY